ncbi:MAG: YggS family pyridoxal phosphate-dependent enzyme [Planctomycetes bacterium]|nr:YggS family pyridoxal phosphate-dependent enzyme [Planctomycetota bacterium]
MVETRRLDLADFRRRFSEISREVAAIAARTRAGGGAPPRIVVVTKYLAAADSLRLAAAGYGPLGENRANALEERAPADAARNVEWHFIGHLQRNKIARVLPRVGLFHALDSRRLAAAIEEWCRTNGTTARCLAQVNVSSERSKGGLPHAGAAAEILQWTRDFPAIDLRGLMTIAPLVDAENCRSYFRQLRELRDSLRADLSKERAAQFQELSMGMSNDYPVAVEEGATLLRLGSVLYR